MKGKVKTLSRIRNGEGVEKLGGILVGDKKPIVWVAYRDPCDSGRKVVSVASAVGCAGRCKFCLSGRTRPFVRPLTAGEIASQALACIEEARVVNFACEGDAVCSNLDNSCRAIKMLCRLNLGLTFIITTTGHQENLKRFLQKYGELPIRFYWSLNFLNPGTREYFMPGTKGSSLVGLRNIFEEIYRATGRVVTVSWVVMAGLNDSVYDAGRIGQFFNGRAGFEIKLMALEPGSLPGIETHPEEDIERFGQFLTQVGVPFRVRKIVGGRIKAGCGTTAPLN